MPLQQSCSEQWLMFSFCVMFGKSHTNSKAVSGHDLHCAECDVIKPKLDNH